jgi:hypothetical protein
MLDVVPLKYGTAFKKAFGDPEVFSGFAQAVLGIDVQVDRVEQEHGFRPLYGQVDIKYDLFAEDPARRLVIELQHVREDDSFDRFLYYHLLGQAEQIQSADDYRFRRTVYTIVVLTRWPSDPALRFDVAVHDGDLRTLDGAKLGVYGHRLVFVNARGLRPETPAPLRRWLEVIEDSLDQKVDETRYPEPLLQRVLRTIERSHLSPHEAFLLKEEAGWESAKREARGEGKEEGLREGEAKGLREGEAKGLREGEAKGLRTAVLDACELLGIAPTEAQRASLDAMGVSELEALRAALKQHRRWPT